MKKLAVPALLALLLLAGCASTGEAGTTPTVTPSWTPNPNSAACEKFAALTMSVPSKVASSTPANDMWESVRVSYDEVALTATGTVKDRMLALVNAWPDLFDTVVLHKFDDYNGKILAVQRACTAEGVRVTFGTLTDK